MTTHPDSRKGPVDRTPLTGRLAVIPRILGGRPEPGRDPLAWRLVVFLLIVKIVGITFALHLI